MDKVIRETLAQGRLIYEEYKKPLAAFGAEPSVLPEDPEGGVAGLLDWILGEFTALSEVLGNTTDNAAIVSCESILAILDHEGCQDLSRLGSRDFVYPSHSELGRNLENIQAVKKSFVRRFCKETERGIMREIARSRLEVAKAVEAEVASALEGTEDAGTSEARPADADEQALVVARLVYDVAPMNIGCEGVIVPGSAWERYSFAHPGASVTELLIACKEDPSVAL